MGANAIEVANKRIMRTFIQALEQEDPKLLRSTLGEAVVWRLPRSTRTAMGLPDAIEGVDAVVDFVDQLLNGTYTRDGCKRFVIDALLADGDQVAAVFTLRTRSPAGDPYENDYVYLASLQDGRIVRLATYTDTAHTYDSLVR